MTQSRSVLISQRDHDRLQSVISKTDPDTVGLLFDELDSATIVPDDELPDDVVAMGSRVTFEDIDTGAQSTIQLVFPHQADAAAGRISVLAPVGAALIGLRVGETIEWPLPGGKVRNLRVIGVERGAE
ncbi:MAG TPA: nucleoside diphosphate kinase regulator [Pseudomonadales bacterium]